jgi:hypothetical protein
MYRDIVGEQFDVRICFAANRYLNAAVHKKVVAVDDSVIGS